MVVTKPETVMSKAEDKTHLWTKIAKSFENKKDELSFEEKMLKKELPPL